MQQVKDVCSVSEERFPIWAHVRFHHCESASARSHSELIMAARDFLKQACLNRAESQTCNRYGLMTAVLGRLNIPPPYVFDDGSRGRCSWNVDLSKVETSLLLQRTSEGILMDLTKIALFDALSISECDKTTWEAFHRRLGETIIRRYDPAHKKSSEMHATVLGASWWGRPLWAWTWHERLFAHATIIAFYLIEKSPFKVRVDLSNSKDYLSESTIACKSIGRYDYPVQLFYSEAICSTKCDDSNVDKEDEMDDGNISIVSKKTLQLNDDVETKQFLIVESTDNCCVEEFRNTPKEHQISPVQRKCQEITTISLHPQPLEGASSFQSPTVQQNNASDKSALFVSNRTQNVTLSPTGLPQYDSQGINMTLLSQLPAQVRSEVRLAMAIQGKLKKQNESKTSIRRWFSGPRKMTHPTTETKRDIVKSLKPSTSKKRGSIQVFFRKKE